MKPRSPSSLSQRGSVLVIVMLVAFGLISIALYFANSMSLELRASDNRTSTISAGQAIEGASRYVSYILSQYATNGAMPDPAWYQAEAVPVGDATASEQNAHFWIIGRDPAGQSSSADPYFGLIDEGSKLNLNLVGTNTLASLPGMTVDFANAIVDWRDTNGTMVLNYAQLGYEPKHASFESVDELRLVANATVDLLAGEDINRNGVLDPNEADLNGNNKADPGLLEYATVYTREPNFHSDGSSMTNVTVNFAQSARSLLQSFLGSSRASQIMNNFASAAIVTTNIANGRGTVTAIYTATNLMRFFLQSQMSTAELGQIINNITFSSSAYTRGRINVNTASADVLTALFTGLGVDQNTASGAAQQLVNYRQQNRDNLVSIGWIVDCLGRGTPVIQALARGDYVTTRTFQFTADIAATGAYGRGYQRTKFIFDIAEGTPKIVYRQDLSRLGWALGTRTRTTWTAQATQ